MTDPAPTSLTDDAPRKRQRVAAVGSAPEESKDADSPKASYCKVNKIPKLAPGAEKEYGCDENQQLAIVELNDDSDIELEVESVVCRIGNKIFRIPLKN